ncbi:AI-2E family transporter [soil metagenome]
MEARETVDVEDQPRIRLHMPVDVKSLALAVIAVLMSIYLIKWAAEVLIPIMLGVLVSYALSPVVDRLERWRINRGLASGVVLILLVAGIARIAYTLSGDVTALAQTLPDAAAKLERLMADRGSGKDSPIDIVQRTAQRLEQAAASAASAPVVQQPRGVQRVQIEKPRFNVHDYLWSGTMGLLNMLGQAVMVVFIAFFLLASGKGFRKKLVKLAGPKLSQKKVTVQALEEISGQIQRYLLVQVFTSVLVGVATWVAFAMLGLEQAAVLGVASAALNLVPYAGALVITAVSMLVAFMQSGTIEMALATGGASIVIHGIVGHVVTPWLTSRASRINPVVVFVGVLIWGWLWGLWGLLLGVPILMVIKAVCDRVEDLAAIAELLES